MRQINASGAILAIEMEINAIEHELEILSMDIDYLNSLKNDLYYNRVFLKKEKVVTSLVEYRRNMYETALVDTKIKAIKNLITQLDIKMDIKVKALDYYTKLFELESDYLSRKILFFKRNDNE